MLSGTESSELLDLNNWIDSPERIRMQMVKLETDVFDSYSVYSVNGQSSVEKIHLNRFFKNNGHIARC